MGCISVNFLVVTLYHRYTGYYPWGNWAKGVKISLYDFLQWPVNPQLSQRIKKKKQKTSKQNIFPTETFSLQFPMSPLLSVFRHHNKTDPTTKNEDIFKRDQRKEPIKPLLA